MFLNELQYKAISSNADRQTDSHGSRFTDNSPSTTTYSSSTRYHLNACKKIRCPIFSCECLSLCVRPEGGPKERCANRPVCCLRERDWCRRQGRTSGRYGCVGRRVKSVGVAASSTRENDGISSSRYNIYEVYIRSMVYCCTSCTSFDKNENQRSDSLFIQNEKGEEKEGEVCIPVHTI